MSLSGRVSDLATRIGQEVKSLWTAVNAKAPLASPSFSGTPTAPTAAAGTSTTQIATTAFVTAAVFANIDAGTASSVFGSTIDCGNAAA